MKFTLDELRGVRRGITYLLQTTFKIVTTLNNAYDPMNTVFEFEMLEPTNYPPFWVSNPLPLPPHFK